MKAAGNRPGHGNRLMTDLQFESDGARFRYCEKATEACDTRLFDINWVLNQDAARSLNSLGRGQVEIMQHRDKTLVIRRYFRGGLMRHLSSDRYLWTGLNRTRAWREFDVLLKLQELGLPAPAPYACSVRKVDFLSYNAALITHFVPGTETLAQRLQTEELTDQQWHDIGFVVRRFHDASLDHSDLNANNILIDEDRQIYLIDFDKAKFRAGANQAWKLRNTKRLQRSIMKCRMAADVFFYRPASWEFFKAGYSQSG